MAQWLDELGDSLLKDVYDTSVPKDIWKDLILLQVLRKCDIFEYVGRLCLPGSKDVIHPHRECCQNNMWLVLFRLVSFEQRTPEAVYSIPTMATQIYTQAPVDRIILIHTYICMETYVVTFILLILVRFRFGGDNSLTGFQSFMYWVSVGRFAMKPHNGECGVQIRF